MPDVIGLAIDSATTLISDAGLVVSEILTASSETLADGLVSSAAPEPGTLVDPGTEVVLEVSTGPEPPPSVPVPDLSGLEEEAAVASLEGACSPSPCLVASVARDFSDDLAEGMVLRQDPEPGATAEMGSTVVVIVSLGPMEVEPEGTAATPFVGNWTNQDLNTGGNTRFEIAEVGGMIAVHAYGKCHPTDCDWETELGEVSGTTAQIIWDQGFVVREMQMELLPDGRLQVRTDHVYSDGRPERSDEAMFVRDGP
jgi:hypothetical protein